MKSGHHFIQTLFFVIALTGAPIGSGVTKNISLESTLSLLENSREIDINYLGPVFESKLNAELSDTEKSNLLRLIINIYFSDGFQDKFIYYAKQLEQHAIQTNNDTDRYIAELFLVADRLNIPYKSQAYYQLISDKKLSLEAQPLDVRNLQLDIILLTLSPEAFKFSREQILINHLTNIREQKLETPFEYLILKALSSSQSQIDNMLYYANNLIKHAKEHQLPVNRSAIIHNIGYYYHFRRMTIKSRQCAELQLTIARENDNPEELFFAQARMVEQLDQEKNYQGIIDLANNIKNSDNIPSVFWRNFIDYYEAIALAYNGHIEDAENTYQRLYDFLSQPELKQYALLQYFEAHLAFNQQNYRHALNTFNDYWWHRYNHVLQSQQKQVDAVRAELQLMIDEKNSNIMLAERRLIQFKWLTGLLIVFGLFIGILILKTKRDARALSAYSLKLRALSRVDDLTNLYNRRYIQNRIEQTFELYLRDKNPARVLLLLDIDHFKRINDTYGHLAGDKVLTDVAKMIDERVRKSDLCGRYGGEEFIILLQQSDVDDAQKLAEDLRINIEKHPIIYKNSTLHVTISIGLSVIDSSMQTAQDWIQQADTAMYQSKQKGRNKTTIYSL